MKKKCSKCKVEKDLNSDNFCKRQSSKDGFDHECKLCKKKRDKDRYKRKRDQILKQKKEYYQKNRDSIISRQISYYRKNKLQCLESAKKWDNKNPNRRRVINGKSRTHSQNLKMCLTTDEWSYCKEYFGNACAYCGLPEKDSIENNGERLHQEHVIPMIRGGEYIKNNIIPACRSCNSKKGNREFNAWYKCSDIFSENRYKKIISYLREV